eukprot:TRINITY_DN778_c0_g1_i3.p2 TRINITY_DN778_c0_g1~~TRINITY_DN778_c0_g1_i3.p2  ORF type:complete len:415 (-),score=46.65 TRINITY_DN778_c0_g1_i3:3912-5156(-)
MAGIERTLISNHYLVLQQALVENASRTLVKFNFDNCTFEAPQIRALCDVIKSAPSLKSLKFLFCSLSSEAIEQVCQAVAENKGISSLTIQRNIIEADGIKSLGKLVTSTSHLTSLKLGFMTLDPSNAAPFYQSLGASSSIKNLSLKMVSFAFKTDAWTIFCRGLSHSCGLTQLRLDFSVVDIAQLFQAIDPIQTLEHLSITYPQFGYGAEGAVAVADLLAKPRASLRFLDATRGDFGSGGIGRLSEALKINTSLTWLNLSGNNIRNEGAALIANALTVNATLTHLDVSNNYIEDFGAVEIGKALRTNRSLRVLKMGKNQYGYKHAPEFIRFLESNTTLTHLDLRDERVNEQAATALFDVLKTNQTLRYVDIRGGAYWFEDKSLPIPWTLIAANESCSVQTDDHLRDQIFKKFKR